MYCPLPTVEIECPEGHYCDQGSRDPKVCIPLSVVGYRYRQPGVAYGERGAAASKPQHGGRRVHSSER
jgi:hypothetical protein